MIGWIFEDTKPQPEIFYLNYTRCNRGDWEERSYLGIFHRTVYVRAERSNFLTIKNGVLSCEKHGSACEFIGYAASNQVTNEISYNHETNRWEVGIWVSKDLNELISQKSAGV